MAARTRRCGWSRAAPRARACRSPRTSLLGVGDENEPPRPQPLLTSGRATRGPRLSGSHQARGLLDLDRFDFIPQLVRNLGWFGSAKTRSPKETKVLRRRSSLFGWDQTAPENRLKLLFSTLHGDGSTAYRQNLEVHLLQLARHLLGCGRLAQKHLGRDQRFVAHGNLLSASLLAPFIFCSSPKFTLQRSKNLLRSYRGSGRPA